MTLDLETRVLNDLDEKLHGLISISIDSPKLIKMVYDTPYEVTEEIPYAYYILFMCAHAYHMKEKNLERKRMGRLATMDEERIPPGKTSDVLEGQGD